MRNVQRIVALQAGCFKEFDSGPALAARLRDALAVLEGGHTAYSYAELWELVEAALCFAEEVADSTKVLPAGMTLGADGTLRLPGDEG